MTQIVLDDKQADVVTRALEPVAVCNPKGEIVAYIEPVWSGDDIAEAKRRLASQQPRFTTGKVLEHLRSLGAE